MSWCHGGMVEDEAMGTTELVGHEHVILDPERLADCADLAHALEEETGTQLDPAAVREALRKLARAQR